MRVESKHLIIFDWDGTLMDSLSLIVSAFQHAAAKTNLPVPKGENVKPLIGLGLPEAIRAAFDGHELDSHVVAEFSSHYSELYVQQSPHSQSLFPGAMKMLEELVALGYPLAVATGKSRVGLERAFNQTGTRDLFSFSRCADETCSKPDPKMLTEILEESGVSASGAIMIGDTHFDLEMANALGVTSVGVSYGAQSIGSLEAARPGYIAHSIGELSTWIQSRLRGLSNA